MWVCASVVCVHVCVCVCVRVCICAPTLVGACMLFNNCRARHIKAKERKCHLTLREDLGQCKLMNITAVYTIQQQRRAERER